MATVMRESHCADARIAYRADVTWAVNGYGGAADMPVNIKVGDVLFFNRFIVHRSGQMGRRSFMPLARNSSFHSRAEARFMQRGYLSACTRSLHRELVDFRGVDGVIYDVALAQGL